MWARCVVLVNGGRLCLYAGVLLGVVDLLEHARMLTEE